MSSLLHISNHAADGNHAADRNHAADADGNYAADADAGDTAGAAGAPEGLTLPLMDLQLMLVEML